jgi:hypothetical protein
MLIFFHYLELPGDLCVLCQRIPSTHPYSPVKLCVCFCICSRYLVAETKPCHNSHLLTSQTLRGIAVTSVSPRDSHFPWRDFRLFSWYSGSLWAGRPGIESRWEWGFPHPPWGQPSLLVTWYRLSIPVVKRPGRCVNHPPPSSFGVRVQLYLYSPSVPSWAVIGWTVWKGLKIYRFTSKLFRWLPC